MPDAIATARRVQDAAAADLETILADLARWVACDTPSGATDELDRMRSENADLKRRLERLEA